tara:strand:- start:167 stop:646 length:480 start_codon:yes stop_codon:yes gene_type:complete
MSKSELQNELQGYLDKVVSVVDEHGLAIQTVLHSHTYSIGLAHKGMPDIIVMGIEKGISEHMINATYKRWLEVGVSLDNINDIIGDGVNPMPVGFRSISLNDEVESFFNVGNCYYQIKPVQNGLNSYVQLLWPDTNGLLPTDDGYDNKNLPQQLLMGVN